MLLLVQVRDDTVIEYQSMHAVCMKDSLELFMATYPGSRSYFQMEVSPGADPKQPNTRIYFWDERGSKATGNLTAEAKGRKTDDGYQVEVLLPWKNMGFTPKLGAETAFQLVVNDSDTPGSMPTTDWFRSFWNPLGFSAFNHKAYQRLRLATEPTPAEDRQRSSEEPEANGLCRVEPLYNYPVLDIPRLDGITIDGTPGDWGDRGFQQRNLTDENGKMREAANFDPSFRLGWDERGLLVLAQVRDQSVTEYPEAAEMWRKDSFEVYLAPKRGSSEAIQIGMSISGDPRHPTVRWYGWDNRKKLKTGPLAVETAGALTPDGYRIEALLPWMNLGITPAVGGEIGVQVCANDSDAGDSGASPAYRAVWHPGGHALMNPMAFQRVRLATAPSAPLQFTRGARDDDGNMLAVPPYPWPMPGMPDVQTGEDKTWNGVWSGAVHVEKTAFDAELAIPWKTLEAAGLQRDSLTVNVDRHGRLQDRPLTGFQPLTLDTAEGGAHRYTVRLHFAELDDVQPGQRVFDVKLQGQTVLKGFDIVKEAGIRTALVKEFSHIRATDALALEFVPRHCELPAAGAECNRSAG